MFISALDRIIYKKLLPLIMQSQASLGRLIRTSTI